MSKYTKKFAIGILSIMLMTGFFVNPTIVHGSEHTAQMQSHLNMTTTMNCSGCTTPIDMTECIQHCLQQTATHLDNLKSNQPERTNNTPSVAATNFSLTTINNYQRPLTQKLIHKDFRLDNILKVQKRE